MEPMALVMAIQNVARLLGGDIDGDSAHSRYSFAGWFARGGGLSERRDDCHDS